MDHSLCPDCRQTIRWVGSRFCPRCSLPSGGDHANLCRESAAGRPVLEGVRAAAEFEGVIRQAVHALKYRGRTDLAHQLAGLMAEAWNEGPLTVDCIVPVPLHSRRLAERGYDQAVLLARELAAGINVPVLEGALVRSRMTDAQTGLDGAGRQKNVAGAFVARPEEVNGRSVLLVDDVCTTGSTLEACASALLAANAAQVSAFTLARARRDPTTGTLTDSLHRQFQPV